MKWGKKHLCECLVRMENCFVCGNICHKVRDCPNVRRKDKGNVQAQAISLISEAPNRNSFYALCSRDEQEESHDVVT